MRKAENRVLNLDNIPLNGTYHISNLSDKELKMIQDYENNLKNITGKNICLVAWEYKNRLN